MGSPKTPPEMRALLIGSSFKNLPGTDNDVREMANILEIHGFDVANGRCVKRLCDKNATRQNILDAWEELLRNTSSDDTVLIYYSGHGGLAESETDSEQQQRKRIQFLVPSDFDPSLKEWRGILDSEI